jgi:hypothetical protein
LEISAILPLSIIMVFYPLINLYLYALPIENSSKNRKKGRLILENMVFPSTNRKISDHNQHINQNKNKLWIINKSHNIFLYSSVLSLIPIPLVILIIINLIMNDHKDISSLHYFFAFITFIILVLMYSIIPYITISFYRDSPSMVAISDKSLNLKYVLKPQKFGFNEFYKKTVFYRTRKVYWKDIIKIMRNEINEQFPYSITILIHTNEDVHIINGISINLLKTIIGSYNTYKKYRSLSRLKKSDFEKVNINAIPLTE